MSELKLCPFCGGDDLSVVRTGKKYLSVQMYCVLCDECGCGTGHWFDKGNAKEAWNRRADNDRSAEAIKDVLLTLEAEAVSSDKFIREYDGSEVQKAYNQALWKAYNLVKEMVGEDL